MMKESSKCQDKKLKKNDIQVGKYYFNTSVKRCIIGDPLVQWVRKDGEKLRKQGPEKS